ncbi:CxxC motif-containing protein, DUF1111 family [Filimonas lacunae]|uniref:CxxC motif-containing protein, DUF1111 family n=1 Tax=Filimonas lacunae TaxID=477680 RepID=A0A173MD38_9BACT|nr:di-heme oxidoredictase family protein [Filimonas lacunae]BAV05503.1 thiol oxidoreductase with 2 cytochrome c heme-binding sites [Filimonas lacunae]SIT20689.1 CxxC motif-containing protein, DUF1111 family [Filimonas lacunae]
MKKLFVLSALIILVTLFTMCNKAGLFPDSGYDDRLSGGAATVFDETSKAFTHSFDGLSERNARVHGIGDGDFSQTFVSSPAPLFGGLGPVFNNVSCISCHHNDGKGTPTAGDIRSSLLFRTSLPGMDENGGPVAVPGFGLQLQDRALINVQPEVKINISYADSLVTYPDGSVATLRKPSYTVASSYIPLPAGYMLSPRLAPPVFGAGLLESIPDQTITDYADENDANGDGISGKPNYVYNPATGKKELGRFGLKANTSTLLTQVAAAYQQDMGITSYLFPKESVYGQSQADQLTDDPELPDTVLRYVTYYVQTLAVPARRSVNENRGGEQLFIQVNCASCHRQTIQTDANVAIQMGTQRIHPYTDLLLHDMGSALSDGRPDFLATGNEWRTMPLWGIGLFEKTNGIPYYLHDGRARTIEEAILWHGGEATKAKQQYMQLSKADRNQLLNFLKTL